MAPAVRKGELRGPGAHPADNRRPRIEEASYFRHGHCPFHQCWVQGRTLSPGSNIRVLDKSQSFSGPVLTFSWCLRAAKGSGLP